ncbi:MAG: YraN family protein [Actinobacteria bacterium]|nr:YraN family protein [Actinomycetota bacterium]
MSTRLKKPGPKQRTGAFGESKTAEFVTDRGDEILDRNWRIREGEIDLVSLSRDGIFHFIEVKTRSSLTFGHPFEAINKDKAHRMQRLALAWLATHGCLGCEYAIDVVAVLISADGAHTLEYRGNIL